MQRRIIPSQDHPSNLDPTARLVASRLGEKWDVFSVVGGFMAGAVLPGLGASPWKGYSTPSRRLATPRSLSSAMRREGAMIRASATTPRRPLSPSKKLLLLEDQGHICPLCENEMRPGDKLIDEHMRSLGLSGSNDLDNRAMVHLACAEEKTRGPDGDHARIVKAKAQKRAAFGFDRPKRPMQGGRNSHLKRLIGGGVVFRATGEPA